VPRAAPLSVHEILRWPGVLAEPTVDADTLCARALALVDEVLGEPRGGARREGAKLSAILTARLDDIEAQVARVAPRIPGGPPRLHREAPRAAARGRARSQRGPLKQELALFATKVDVDEELARLATHVAEFRRVLVAGGSTGKRLDFLAQELHREANTLGSKSVDTELSRAALELKVLIEQIREQVQNIE
jgi:uncharacterized protein (TIGR00255 family)